MGTRRERFAASGGQPVSGFGGAGAVYGRGHGNASTGQVGGGRAGFPEICLRDHDPGPPAAWANPFG